jgi:hypothetical protein
MQACLKRCQGKVTWPCYLLDYATSENHTVDSLLNFFCPLNHLFQDTISKLLQEAEEETRPAYAPKKSDTIDGRPKYGSRKEFFRRVWDRLHGSDSQASKTSTQADGIPKFDGSTAIAILSRGFSLPANEVIRPIPIRYAIPFSSSNVSIPLCRDIHYDYIDESCIGSRNLIDNKYRRVTSSTPNEIKKRHFSAFDIISDQSKKPKV